MDFNLSILKCFYLIIFFCTTLQSKPLSTSKRSLPSIPDPYTTWGEYCRMKNPFHPRCRGIAVQKLIELSVDQMEPEYREQYREYLIGYLVGKYPNVIKKLLNHQVIRKMIIGNDHSDRTIFPNNKNLTNNENDDYWIPDVS